MLNIAHFRTPFLSLSETFIYTPLTHFSNDVVPFVFTTERVNQNQFPFKNVIDHSLPRYSSKWLREGLCKKIFGKKDVHLKQEIKRHDIHLLHAHFGPQGWALMNVKRELKLPLITTFYGYDLSYLAKEELWRRRYAELFKEGDLFLVEGPFMKEALIRLGCPEDKVRLQPIAIDVQNIPYRERLPKEGENVTFLFCGRFVEKKGLVYALQAFGELLSEGMTNFEFRVIGDGDQRPQIKNVIQKNRLDAHVVLLGFRNHKEFRDELKAADIVIAPSVTSPSGDSEGGAPTVLLEAQAAGVPILSTTHADIPYVVVEGKSALLSPERDVKRLKENIQRLMTQQSLWKEFGCVGWEHVSRHHDIQHEVKKLEELYRAVLKKGAA